MSDGGKALLTVRVTYAGLVRNVAGVPEQNVVLPAGSRVRDLFTFLQERHGENLRHVLFTNTGVLRPLAQVFVGERNVQELDGLDTRIELTTGVRVLLLDHALGGG